MIIFVVHEINLNIQTIIQYLYTSIEAKILLLSMLIVDVRQVGTRVF